MFIIRAGALLGFLIAWFIRTYIGAKFIEKWD
jgi:hypothetical protein